MPHIVKEPLDVTGQDRVDFALCPCVLDPFNEGRASVRDGGPLPPAELVGGEEAEGV